MVDIGGVVRERFLDVGGEEAENILAMRNDDPYHPSDQHHNHHHSSASSNLHIPTLISWRQNLQSDGSSMRDSLVDCRPMPSDLLQIKTDPEALASLCVGVECVGMESASTSKKLITTSNHTMLLTDPVNCTEDSVNARARVLQEITRAAESYESYSASPAPDVDYRSYEIPHESSSHPEYQLPDTAQWYWTKSQPEGQNHSLSDTGGMVLAPDQLTNSITSDQLNVASSQSSQHIPQVVSSTEPTPPPESSTPPVSSVVLVSSTTSQVKSKPEGASSRERQFICEECGMTFLAKAMLVRHRKVHTGEKPYKCDICETRFTESGSLKVHKRSHSGEKPFKCDVCSVAFSGASMLATHKRLHTGEKPYKCEDCDKSFRLLSTLKSHKRRHTGEKPFVCEVCGSSFTQRAPMQRHKRIHSDHKPWECDQCGYKFREKENLRKHVALHMIKLKHLCTVCGEGFNQAKKLETHKMIHNGGERPYQCNKCPSTFTKPKYLTQHKKRVHNKKGAIRCEECNGTFKRKESLRAHMRIHTGERRYVCEECGAAFNQRGPLTKHMRTRHSTSTSKSKTSDTKTHKQEHFDKSHSYEDVDNDLAEYVSCPVCQMDFSTLEEMVFHKRSSHPELKNSSAVTTINQDDDSSEHIRDKYVCDDCDQTFFRRRQLKAHKKYCPRRCPSYQFDTGTPEVHRVVTSLHTETKEVDAMKLLSAALGVTGTDPELDSHPQTHLSTHRLPSPQHYPSPSLSPQRYPSPLSPSYPALSPHYAAPLPVFPLDKNVDQDIFTYTDNTKQIHTDHMQVSQDTLHLPHLQTQLPDHLRYSASDQLLLMVHQQNALKQLSEDNIMKLAEEHSQQQQLSQNSQQYLRQSDHSSTRTQSQYMNHSLSQTSLHDHLPSPLDHDQSYHAQTQQLHDSLSLDPDQQHIRDDIMQDSLPLNCRHDAHIPQTLKDHKILEYQSHSPGISPIEPPSSHSQVAPPMHTDRPDEHFYRDSPLTLPGQSHFPHIHQSLHTHQFISEAFTGDDNPDDVASIEQLEHSHSQNQHYLQHFYHDELEEDNQGRDKQHYHHQSLLHQSHHLPLGNSEIIKTESELAAEYKTDYIYKKE